MIGLILGIPLTDGPKSPGGAFLQPRAQSDPEQRYPRPPVLRHHAIRGRRGHLAGVGAGGGRLGRVRHQQHQPHVSKPAGDVRPPRNFRVPVTSLMVLLTASARGFFLPEPGSSSTTSWATSADWWATLVLVKPAFITFIPTFISLPGPFDGDLGDFLSVPRGTPPVVHGAVRAQVSIQDVADRIGRWDHDNNWHCFGPYP